MLSEGRFDRNFRLLSWRRWIVLASVVAVIAALAGCHSAGYYHRQADKVAYHIIKQTQKKALGHTEPFTISRPADLLRRKLLLAQDLPYTDRASLGVSALKPLKHWPDDPALTVGKHPGPATQPAATQPAGKPLELSLEQALEIAAHNSRSYQSQKEQVYTTALDLDLQRNQFRNIFSSTIKGRALGLPNAGKHPDAEVSGSGDLGVARELKNGINITATLTASLVKMLTGDKVSASGLLGDASISIPFLRGSGQWVVAEPLTQAERNTLYAIDDFDRFKRTFAVNIASSYFSVLQRRDQITNAAENYKDLIIAVRRSRALAKVGRLPGIQVDQAVQDELSARSTWISAQQTYARVLDQFKIQLGLPTDADVKLDHNELKHLSAQVRSQLPEAAMSEPARQSGKIPPANAPVHLQPLSMKGAGPLEINAFRAIRIALSHRRDLRVARGRVYDAERQIPIAANAFLPGATVTFSGAAGGTREAGSAGSGNISLRPGEGSYNALLDLNLPLERTAERNQYRKQIINLHGEVRSFQGLEDQIKLEVRDDLRSLLESREALQIQSQAVALAKRRVKSTTLFLKLGRAQVRDVLDAQASLLSAQDALTAALVNYRVGELDIQRDMGVLKVNENGLWKAYVPEEANHGK